MLGRSHRIAMQLALVTGFPGLVGSNLVGRLFRRDVPLVLLCERRFGESAERKAEVQAAKAKRRDARYRIVRGDLREPGLGLPPEEVERLAGEVDTVFHLGALHDWRAPRAEALATNAGGTRNLLELARRFERLERFHHVSALEVAGRRGGRIPEAALDGGAGFHNAFEESVFGAESAVRAAIERDGLPATIHRLGMVVGDSWMGRTLKYDGAYHMLRFQARLPGPLRRTNPGSRRARVPLAPADFVADALVALAASDEPHGATHHVADPSPPTAAELCEAFRLHAGLGPSSRPTPRAALALLRATGLAAIWGMPRAAWPYFELEREFETGATTERLAAAGVRCPPLAGYAEKLARFYLAHPIPGGVAL